MGYGLRETMGREKRKQWIKGRVGESREGKGR